MKELKFPKLERMKFRNKQEQGDFAERWVSKYLKHVFGFTVVKTEKSRSAFDLFAFSDAELWLVQVRSGSCIKWGKQKEIDKMLAFPAPENAKRIIIRIDAFDDRPHIRDLADKTKSWWVRKTKQQRAKIEALRARNKKRSLTAQITTR